jgi:hypothetical protein
MAGHDTVGMKVQTFTRLAIFLAFDNQLLVFVANKIIYPSLYFES